MSRLAAPLTADEASRLAGLLELLASCCEHSAGSMHLALWRHGIEDPGAVEELRADLAMYAWILAQ